MHFYAHFRPAVRYNVPAMEKKTPRPDANDLERVITKNRERIAGASQELREALLAAGMQNTVPRETLESALGLYRDLRARLIEIESVRGVLTHLRRTTLEETRAVFERLLSTQFPEVKCILISIRSPGDLDEELLGLLERTAGEMRQGEMRVIDRSQQKG